MRVGVTLDFFLNLSRAHVASAALPGATVSRLAPLELPGNQKTDTPPAAPAVSWLPSLEPWRLVLAVALLWTLLEWRLYCRRITE